MDMYVYPFGNPGRPVVLKDVSYGAVSAYVAVVPGQYTVAMRGFDAPATSKPALTASFMVTGEPLTPWLPWAPTPACGPRC